MKKIVFLLPILLSFCSSCNNTKIDFFISADKTILKINEYAHINISFSDEKVSDLAKFSCVSSDESILKLDSMQNNIITLLAVNFGNVEVTVTEATTKIERSINFTVESDVRVSLNESVINISENNTFQLIATGCEVIWSSDNSNIATVEDGLVTGVNKGNTIVTATSVEAPSVSAKCQVYVHEQGEYIPSRTTMQQTYKDYAKNLYWSNYSVMPNEGTANLLIIPIWFTDSGDYITDNNKKEFVREDIELAYLGANKDIGYRSVKTYYEEESGGKLTINGYITDWYETNDPSSDYYVDSSSTRTLLRKAVEWVRAYEDIDLKDYDNNADGYLDGVVMVYAYPDYVRLGDRNKSNLWAYCGHDTNMSADVNNPTANVYFWASYDFMYGLGADRTYERTGSSYGGGSVYRQVVDPITFVHETGHMFGLYDYYDYTSDHLTPAGTYTMQDENVSTHDPFSYMALNWADPYIPEQSCTLTIGEFATTHDVILLTPEWNQYDSAFDEYILIELYNLTGLNEYYKGDWFQAIELPDGVGIRVWHVDARLAGNPTSALNWYPTSNVHASGTVYKMADNSHAKINSFPSDQRGSFLYENQNMLQLISRTEDRNYGSLNRNYNFINSDLFLENDTFTLDDYKKQFTGSDGNYYIDSSDDIRLNNGSKLNWSFTVDDITTINGHSTATITLNKLA